MAKEEKAELSKETRKELIFKNYKQGNFELVVHYAKGVDWEAKTSGETLRLIGESLIKVGKNQKGLRAIGSYYNARKDSLENSKRELVERDIAEQLCILNKSDKSKVYWNKYAEATFKNYLTCPYQERQEFIRVERRLLEKAKKRSINKGITINFSYEKDTWRESENFASLLFIHIQKSGGIAFVQPMRELCLQLRNASIRGERTKTDPIKCLCLPRSLTRREECEIINKRLELYNTEEQSGALLATHGAPWIETYKTMKNQINKKTKCIALLRKPDERLLSSIAWELAKKGNNKKEIKRIIEETNYF